MKQWIKLFEADAPAQTNAQQPAQTNAQQPAQTNAQQPAQTNAQQPAQTNAQQPAKPSNSDAELEKIKKLLNLNYPAFVKQLGQNINDPKFLQAIKSLASQDKVELTSMTPTVGGLKPTQNEIDIAKSLAYPLKDPQSMKLNLTGGPVAPGGPIITSAGGRFIIDGHHRWSQVCVCNPNCKIQAYDMSDIKGPFNGLKAAQLGIAAATGTLPVAKVEGSNLLTIDQQSLIDYVLKTITPEVLNVMRQFKLITATDDQQARSQAANYLWNNVATMQKNNQPVAGAPERGIMPQTDTAKDSWMQAAPNPETTVAEQIAKWRNFFDQV